MTTRSCADRCHGDLVGAGAVGGHVPLHPRAAPGEHQPGNVVPPENLVAVSDYLLLHGIMASAILTGFVRWLTRHDSERTIVDSPFCSAR